MEWESHLFNVWRSITQPNLPRLVYSMTILRNDANWPSTVIFILKRRVYLIKSIRIELKYLIWIDKDDFKVFRLKIRIRFEIWIENSLNWKFDL